MPDPFSSLEPRPDVDALLAAEDMAWTDKIQQLNRWKVDILRRLDDPLLERADELLGSIEAAIVRLEAACDPSNLAATAEAVHEQDAHRALTPRD